MNTFENSIENGAFAPFSIIIRNEFSFWNVCGIMNTSGRLQSISEARIHVNIAIMIPRSFQKLNILLIFTFYYKYIILI